MRKISLLILTLSFLVTCLLVGCSDQASKEEESKDGKVKLTALLVKHPLTKPTEEIKWLEEVEERAGVEIEWEEVTADWDQKKGAMLPAGDIPDLIIGANAITDAEFNKYKGLFADLSPLIEEHAPNVQKMFDERPETKVLATQLSGEIYGLPQYKRFFPWTRRQYINQEWIDNLGLETPTNWDELHEVLLAFKEQDANGNGDPNDEVPMDWSPIATTGFGSYQPTLLLGSLGMTLTDTSGDGMFLEDKEVKNFLIDERYKKVVMFLRELWKDELINPEVFTQDYSKFQSLARSDGENAIVGYTYGWEITDRVGNELAPQYKSLGVLKESANSNVDVKWSYSYDSMNYNVNMIQLSAATENKEAAMRFINELYNPEVSLQVLYGTLGENIAKHDDGSFEILPPKNEEMDPGTWKWTSTWADFGPMYISDSLDVTLGTDMQSIDEQTAPLQEAYDNIDIESEVLPRVFLKFDDEALSTISLNRTEYMNLAMSKFSTWVTKGGIEQEWDEYVDDMKGMGIEEVIGIYQKYYDDYKSNQ
ncbi:extracellular solute-binding protein [Gracilibacillus sp. D59]|uniref:extracellular solute-binding protein n=1 Tax=Gracilibacillus sp. D59 TaxID=3457434 RepID=UPI003FCECEE5